MTIANFGYDQPDLVPLRGVTDGSSAAAGIVGQVITSSVATASAISLATGTAANVTSISLTPGDWDVWGRVAFTPTASTTVQYQKAGINSTSATVPTDESGCAGNVEHGTVVSATVNTTINIAPVRVNITANQTWYLVAVAGFGASTMKAFGSITARRMR